MSTPTNEPTDEPTPVPPSVVNSQAVIVVTQTDGRIEARCYGTGEAAELAKALAAVLGAVGANREDEP